MWKRYLFMNNERLIQYGNAIRTCEDLQYKLTYTYLTDQQ